MVVNPVGVDDLGVFAYGRLGVVEAAALLRHGKTRLRKIHESRAKERGTQRCGDRATRAVVWTRHYALCVAVSCRWDRYGDFATMSRSAGREDKVASVSAP